LEALLSGILVAKRLTLHLITIPGVIIPDIGLTTNNFGADVLILNVTFSVECIFLISNYALAAPPYSVRVNVIRSE